MLRPGQMLAAQQSDGLGIAEQLKVGDAGESWQPGADLPGCPLPAHLEKPLQCQAGATGGSREAGYCLSVKE